MVTFVVISQYSAVNALASGFVLALVIDVPLFGLWLGLRFIARFLRPASDGDV